ncbi:MAG: SCP2 sterol-binding domain-containing protein [Lachnospiraceae bacterium]|nr:SCP2 sterol-binding domain-containing protein [Lachnospiraceae bacterium]
MTYQELVSKLKDTYQEKDASKISEHLAIQFNIQGEAEGALYLEIANGQLHIEPYEYYDRDILVTTSAADLLALAQGSLDILEAYQSGKISAEGNLAKALLLNEIVTGSSEAPSPAESAPVGTSASAESAPVETSASAESAPVETSAPAESAPVEAPAPEESSQEETPAATDARTTTPSVRVPRMSRKKNRKRHK